MQEGWPPSARTEEGELPAQPAISLRLLSQDEDALRPADVDHLAVVTADADSFAAPLAVRDVAEVDDGAGDKLPGRVNAGGRVDDALAGGQLNADRVEELDCRVHHRTRSPSPIAPLTMSPM